eukprot:scaffold10623_cov65-Cyclotella_meneghiniana.AAC.6
MAETAAAPSANKPTKAIQIRGKGKALNALAAASGRDPALIAKDVAKAAALKEEEERIQRQAAASAPSGIYNALSDEERYRFECFRRCAFPSAPVEEFVARAMVEEASRWCGVRKSVLTGLTGGMMDDGDASRDPNKDEDEQDATEVTDSSEESNLKKRRRKRTRQSLLNQESKRRRQIMDQPLPYNLITSQQTAASRQQHTTPPLDSLVVPDSASEIVAVVSALAKCYAQRLVAAARRVADAEEEARVLQSVHDDENEQSRNKEDSNTTEAGANSGIASTNATADASAQAKKSIRPLQPHHYMEAHRHRVEVGIDPGFWMLDMISKGKHIGREQLQQSRAQSKSCGVAQAAAVGRKSWNGAYLAALAAQDAYDEMVKEEEKEEEDQKEVGKNNDEEQKMDVEKE